MKLMHPGILVHPLSLTEGDVVILDTEKYQVISLELDGGDLSSNSSWLLSVQYHRIRDEARVSCGYSSVDSNYRIRVIGRIEEPLGIPFPERM